MRTTNDVLRAHLENRRAGRLEDDLEDNYAPDVVVLSHLGHFQGRDAVRTLAQLLDRQLRDAEFFYDKTLVDGPYAFLQWSAVARDFRVSDGADSFVVRNGEIVLQTIYYRLSARPDARNSPHVDA